MPLSILAREDGWEDESLPRYNRSGPRCSGISVGVLIFRNGKLLLGLRRKPPFGWAPPSGHFETSDFTVIMTAQREVNEETGLRLVSSQLKHEKKHVPNLCSRGTTHHDWFVLEGEAVGEAKPKDDETKELAEVDLSEVAALAQRTDRYHADEIPEAEWQLNPGLEPVWVDMLRELKYI